MGNPNVQVGTDSGPSGTFDGAHIYKHAGTYQVYVTFTDQNGDYITVQFALTVS